jgi:hypothetical protein
MRQRFNKNDNVPETIQLARDLKFKTAPAEN